MALMSSIKAPLISSNVQFLPCCYSISSNLLTISLAIEFGLDVVPSSLLLLRSQTQEDLDESMMVAKQGVSMMHELSAMHVCMMHMLCNK